MAVTVTKATPSTTLNNDSKRTPMYVGSYGAMVNGSPNFVNVSTDVIQKKRVVACKWTLSGTYVTGGFTVTAADYGLKEIQGLLLICDSTDSTHPVSAGTVPALDVSGGTATPTVRLYTDTATELANLTSVTNFVFQVLILGV